MAWQLQTLISLQSDLTSTRILAFARKLLLVRSQKPHSAHPLQHLSRCLEIAATIRSSWSLVASPIPTTVGHGRTATSVFINVKHHFFFKKKTLKKWYTYFFQNLKKTYIYYLKPKNLIDIITWKWLCMYI